MKAIPLNLPKNAIPIRKTQVSSIVEELNKEYNSGDINGLFVIKSYKDRTFEGQWTSFGKNMPYAYILGILFQMMTDMATGNVDWEDD